MLELAIKYSIGKLQLDAYRDLDAFIGALARDLLLEPLPVEHAHAVRYSALPLIHRDPFDRILVAQAQVEGLTIVSADPMVRRYDVAVVWDV